MEENPVQDLREVTIMPMVGSPEWHQQMNKLVRKWTGWDSLDHMCRGSPTLRVSAHASDAEAEAIREMRKAFKFITGREAHPQQNWDMKAKKPRHFLERI